MRDFFQAPPAAPPGEAAGPLEGDGPGVIMTVTGGGAVMTPAWAAPGTDPDVKHEYKVYRARGQGRLHAAGRP